VITFQEIEAARERIASAVYYSPCQSSIPLSAIAGMEIFCKLDNLQRTGSFKERGARNALAQLSPEQKKRGVIAASAGNHAQALAYQGQLLGIPATVVMPQYAPLIKVANCQELGANVVLYGKDFAEAKARADEIAAEKGLAYVDGYDDPAIIAGQGTIGLEIVEQTPDLDAVLVPVGGAGLIAGVSLAVKTLRPQAKVIAVEAENVASFSAALEAGQPTMSQCFDASKTVRIGHPTAAWLFRGAAHVCRLDFRATFCLHRSVRTVGNGLSRSAIDQTTQNGAVAFATTHWSVVLTAQGESLAAQQALEKLCRIYWRPIFSFLQRQGVGPEDAEDLTQGFFASLLEHRNLSAVRKEKGRLRSYLLGALKYFLNDERRRAMAIKRGKGQRLIPVEELRADERIHMEPADPVTAELVYERRWASTVLERVLKLLKNEYQAAGNGRLYDSLEQLLPGEPDGPSQADVAAQLGMAENAVRQAFHRFRERYQSLLREEIAHTVATPADIEDELRHLIAVVRA
jgi:RNA polymerase sigma factor (sigma-70 family)